jgi:hypothetical protein
MGTGEVSGWFRKLENKYNAYSVTDDEGAKIGTVDATYVNEAGQRAYVAVRRRLAGQLDTETFDLVTFSSYGIRERGPYLSQTRLTVGEATWKRITRGMVEVLVGGEVYRGQHRPYRRCQGHRPRPLGIRRPARLPRGRGDELALRSELRTPPAQARERPRGGGGQ